MLLLLLLRRLPRATPGADELHGAKATLNELPAIMAEDEAPPPAAPAAPDEGECPICLCDLDGGTTTSLPCCASSTFHAGCLDLWFAHSRTCPLCRRLITAVVVPARTRGCAEPRIATAVAEVLRFNREAARRELSWVERLRDAPQLAREALFDRDVRYLVPPLLRLRMVCLGVGAVAYVLAPFDLLPEATIGAPGVVDDVAVAAIAVLLVAEAFRGAVLSGAL